MKSIYALIAASVLMIVAGVAMIVIQEPEPEPEPEAASAQEPDLGVIPAPAEQDSETTDSEIDAEPGSEPWCEQMMRRPNARWSEEQSQIFADHCIYEQPQNQ